MGEGHGDCVSWSGLISGLCMRFKFSRVGCSWTVAATKFRLAFFCGSAVGFSFMLNLLAGGEIRVGVVTCLSGGLSTFGTSSAQGAKLAAEEIDSAGGVLHQPLTLVIDDNQSKPGETARIVRKFLTQDRVVAIFGDLISSFTMEAAALAQNAHVPLLTPTATNIAITPIGNFIFRSCFTDPFTGRVMARFALEHLHARRAVIMTDIKQDYSVGVAAELKQYFNANGGQLLEELSFSSGDTDFRAQLSKLKAVRPEAVFFPSYYPEVGLILREVRLLGGTAPFVGGEGWDSPALVQISGKSADRSEERRVGKESRSRWSPY